MINKLLSLFGLKMNKPKKQPAKTLPIPPCITFYDSGSYSGISLSDNSYDVISTSVSFSSSDCGSSSSDGGSCGGD